MSEYFDEHGVGRETEPRNGTEIFRAIAMTASDAATAAVCDWLAANDGACEHRCPPPHTPTPFRVPRTALACEHVLATHSVAANMYMAEVPHAAHASKHDQSLRIKIAMEIDLKPQISSLNPLERYSLAIKGCSFRAPESKLPEMLTVYGTDAIHRVEALLQVQLVINDVQSDADVGGHAGDRPSLRAGGGWG